MSGKQDRIATVAQVIIGVVLFVWGVVVMFHAASGADPGGILIGSLLVIAASVFLSPFISEHIVRSGAWILSPWKKARGPQPIYSIPQTHRVAGRFEEAMEGFEQIVNEHPGELDAWLEMIEISGKELQDPARAEAVYRRAMRVLSEEDREQLTHVYKLLSSSAASRSDAQSEPLVLEFPDE